MSRFILSVEIVIKRVVGFIFGKVINYIFKYV